MRGQIFKNFYLGRGNLIFIGVMQALISAVIIVVLCLTGGKASSEYTLTKAFCYALTFFLTAFSYTEFFSCDERQTWVSFAASTPAGARGQVAGKYVTIMIISTAVLLCCLITDVVNAAIAGDFSCMIMGTLLTLYGVEIIICAYEMVFYVGFGSKSGSKVKGMVLGAIILSVILYLLFGDISFLYTDDPLEIIVKFFSTPLPSWGIALLLTAALGLYALSFAISLRLYQNASENYGE